MPRSILSSAVLSVVAAVSISAGGLFLMRDTIRGAVVTHMVADNVDLEACAREPAVWGHRAPIAMFAYDLSGESANPLAPPVEPDLLERARRTRGWARNTESETTVVSVLWMSDGGPCALVRLAAPPPSQVILPLAGTVLIVTTLLGMLVSGLATFWFVIRPLLRRVRVLAEAASGVGTLEFSAPPLEPDALGHIAHVLSDSHRRLLDTQSALERRNQALENHLVEISHDLRTPLASLQLALEAVALETTGHQREVSRRALADGVYLSSLVENLHQATRLQHDVDVRGGLVDLVELVRRLEQRFIIIARHGDVEVAASTPEHALWAACSPTFAERAIANLVQNAVQHNPDPGHVAIVLRELEDGFELVVADDGPGMGDSVLADLRSATFVLDPARRRGPGLGVAITAEIARRAGWTLAYEAVEPRGTRVRIRGPKTEP